MALRPNSELGLATILPKHWTFSNFTTLWSTRPGRQHRHQPGDRRRRHRHRAARRHARRLLHRAPPVPRPRRASCCSCWRPRCSSRPPCWSASSASSPTSACRRRCRSIIVNAGFNLAFAVWILNAFFSSIPAELEEAAMVDGLGRVGALTRITLPLAAPGIVTALIFTFIAAWNEFLVALTLSLGQAAVAAAADRGDQQLHRGVLRRLGAPLRGWPGRHRAGHHPVRLHRASCRERSDSGSG